MKKILDHLKKNWIVYGFETLTIVVGILGAYSLNNWNENRKQRKDDIHFLYSLKSEIEIDTTVFSERMLYYIELNDNLVKALYIFENVSKPNDSDIQIISDAIIDFQVLTPIHKNIGRNDKILAEGTLIRIDNKLNQKYLAYLEDIRTNNDIIYKLGESLQDINIRYVMPKIDLNFVEWPKSEVYFNFNEIRNDRLIKNAFNKSIFWRRLSNSKLNHQLKMADDILGSIDSILLEKNKQE